MNTDKGVLNQGHRFKPSVVQVAVLRGRKCHHLLVIALQLCTGFLSHMQSVCCSFIEKENRMRRVTPTTEQSQLSRTHPGTKPL